MGWTIQDALNDDAIEKTEASGDVFNFWLKGIPTKITVKLTPNPSGGYNFSLSHVINTPSQLGPYHPSRPWGDDLPYALHMAVSSIVTYYKQAVKEGHVPSEEWMVATKQSEDVNKDMDFIFDHRVNCCSVIKILPVKKYLHLIDRIYENRGGIEEQRDPLKTTTAIRIRKRMVDDLKAGAVLPPVVIGVILPNDELEKIKAGRADLSDLIKKAEAGNISIIDGMQRTTALMELSKVYDYDNRKMWVEFWFASNTNSLIYRMLILNTGQVPWNLRRQIEVTFRSMINEIREQVPNLEIYQLEGNTSKRRTKTGQFQAGDLIELFLVFGARKEKINTKERLADEFTRLDFIEATGDPQFNSIFYQILNALVDLDFRLDPYQEADEEGKFKSGKDLFSSQPACVGFVTAMAIEILGRPGADRPHEDQSKRFNDQLKGIKNLSARLAAMKKEEVGKFLDFGTLNQLIVERKVSKAVGDYEREFFLKAFQVLIEEKFEVSSLTPCWRAY